MPLIPDGTYTRKQLDDAIDLLTDARSESGWKSYGVEFRNGALYALILPAPEKDEDPVPAPVAGPKDVKFCNRIGCLELATHGPLTIPVSCPIHAQYNWSKIEAREAA